MEKTKDLVDTAYPEKNSLMPAVRDAVKRYILSNFLPGEKEDNLLDDDLLFESGIIDSMGAISFVAFLETRFGIRVPDEDLFPENFATVDDIVRYIIRKSH